MNRTTVIILGIVGIIIIVVMALIYFLIAPKDNTNNNNTPISIEVPEGFSKDDGEQIQNISQSFFELYHTYEYGDYSNLYASGGYSTPKLQQETITYAESLEGNTPEYFLQIAKVDLKSLQIKKRDIYVTEVMFIAEIEKQYTNNPNSIENKSVNATLTLKVIEGKWKVDSVQIN